MGTKKRLGIIGLGRVGKCIVGGLLHSGEWTEKDICFTTHHDDTGQKVEKELGLSRCPDNGSLVEQCETVLLAVKPQNIAEVLGDIGGKFSGEKTLISVAASYATAHIESQLPSKVAVVRAMPNTPSFVREGMTAFCLGKEAREKDGEIARGIFQHLGRVVQLDERHMDAVTGLSGCGPAYIYVVLEALTEGGVKVGLPRDMANQLAGQTVLGAARMFLETGRHPAELKDEVTTPAGCTIDGLLELEEGGLRVTMIKAVVKSTERAKELAKQPPEK